MTHNEIRDALKGLFPNGGWAVVEGEIKALPDGVESVSEEELAEGLRLFNARLYREARATEYPDLNEQVGAIVKGFESLAKQGVDVPQDMLDVIDKVNAVKVKHPKPEEL